MKKISISNIFKLLGQKIKNNVNKEFLTYLVFLLIAIVVWYLDALNKDYTADLKFTVRYTDLPDDKVLANTPPEHLTLTLNAQGFTLLKYRFRLNFQPVTLEASYQTLRRSVQSSSADTYYIATQSVFDRVAAQLSSDVHLKQIAPDTLKFLLSETVRKEIPVKSTLQLQFEKGFLPRGDMVVEPEKVTVTGPQTLVDTMQFAYTQTKIFRRLNETLVTSVDLQPVHQLRYSVDEVQVVQIVERNTEATLVIPIEPVNLPDSLTMKVFPGTITLSCMVPVVDYEKLEPYMFRAVVDYISVRDETDNQAKARVAILRTPDYVTDVRFHPRNVDFIIEK